MIIWHRNRRGRGGTTPRCRSRNIANNTFSEGWLQKSNEFAGSRTAPATHHAKNTANTTFSCGMLQNAGFGTIPCGGGGGGSEPRTGIIYARCALWVVSLSMRWRLACHKIAVYTKQLSDQKTFTPKTVSLHQTALNSEGFPNESILQDSDTRKLDRCCPLVGQEPSHLVGQVPLPFSPCLFHRRKSNRIFWKKHAEHARKKNTVINWNTTAASKVRKNEASEPAERNERGTSTKRTQVKKHLQQHQEKHDNDYQTKKKWHQKKHKRKCKESGREKDPKRALEILPKKHT